MEYVASLLGGVYGVAHLAYAPRSLDSTPMWLGILESVTALAGAVVVARHSSLPAGRALCCAAVVCCTFSMVSRALDWDHDSTDWDATYLMNPLCVACTAVSLGCTVAALRKYLAS